MNVWDNDEGVVLNSLSGIISYSSYDYSSLLGITDLKKNHHEQSFLRQCVYTVIVTGIYAALTTSSLYMMSQKSSLHIADTYGLPHPVPPMLFYQILIFGWVCHALACVLTVCYYNDHPSHVDMDPRKKSEVWIFGRKRNVKPNVSLLDTRIKYINTF